MYKKKINLKKEKKKYFFIFLKFLIFSKKGLKFYFKLPVNNQRTRSNHKTASKLNIISFILRKET